MRGLTGALFLLSCHSRPTHNAKYELKAPLGESAADVREAFREIVGTPLEPGHEITLANNGSVFDRLVEDIAHARSSVHIAVYIWQESPVATRLTQALVEKASAGVSCRVLVDALGSKQDEFEKAVAPPLRQAGCEVRVFRPSKAEIARSHRRLVIIDGAIAYTGGFAVRDDWLGDGRHEGQWRDTNVRARGPLVLAVQAAFAENWSEAGGGVLGADAFRGEATGGNTLAAFVASTQSDIVTRAERLAHFTVAAARKRLWMSVAYFVPPRTLLDAIAAKARSGVDVRLLTAGTKSDSKLAFAAQRQEYGNLVESGVRIWEYQPSMMHAKSAVIDESLYVVGSINLDPFSLNVLEEGAVVAEDTALNAELARTFEQDCALAVQVR